MENGTEALKSLIGDGQAKVTASREVSEANFGTGGKVFVAITLTCDQSQAAVDAAVKWAAHLAEHYAFNHLGDLRQKLIDSGIIAPRNG